MKVCRGCKTEKPLAEFSPDRRNKDGKQGECYPCRNLRKARVYVKAAEPKVTEKVCTQCRKLKLARDFYRSGDTATGLRGNCKECRNASTNAWRAENREEYNAKRRAYGKQNYQRNRLYRYALTPADYAALVEKQGGKCALCPNTQSGATRPLAIDHDHKSGKVRGLLCYGCNRAMAVIDNPALLAKALKYAA